MKVLVFSDSHRSLREMRRAVEDETPDYVIHLGDLEEDAQLLSQEYPSLPVCSVPGNCDGWTTHPLQKLVDYGGRRVLLSHGPIWGVKGGYGGAIAAGRKAGADVVLFGHTHIPYCQQLEDGMWAMNPGSSRQSYGLILIDGEALLCRLSGESRS